MGKERSLNTEWANQSTVKATDMMKRALMLQA